jgi:hypothetical protein
MPKTTNHVRIVGDTISPLNCVLYANGNPVDLSSLTVKFELEEEDGTVIQAAASTYVTAHPTQTFTASATTDLLTCNGPGVQHGDHQRLEFRGAETLHRPGFAQQTGVPHADHLTDCQFAPPSRPAPGAPGSRSAP